MKNLLLVGILALTIAINFQPCYGIICYICETRKEGLTVEDVVVEVEEGSLPTEATDPNAPTDPPATTQIRFALNAVGTITPGPTPRPKAPEARTKLTSCLGGKKKWLQDECPSQYRACFSMRGQIFERQDNAVVTLEIEKHGCFDTSDGQIMQQGKSGECVDIKTMDQNDTTSTAKLCVCDDENGGNMLCNRGVKKGCNNYNVLILAVAISMLLVLN